MSAWIDSNRGAKRRKRARKIAYKPAGSVAPQSIATTKRSRKRKPDASAAPLAPAQPNSVTGTPLRIPYGNIAQTDSRPPPMAIEDEVQEALAICGATPSQP
jgi:hypothetical protein